MKLSRLLALCALALMLAATGYVAFDRWDQSLDCLGEAKAAELYLFSTHTRPPTRLLLRFDPGGGALAEGLSLTPVASFAPGEGKQRALELLSPFEAPPPAEVYRPGWHDVLLDTEVTVRLTCDGGHEHVRHLYAGEPARPLSECFERSPYSVSLSERRDCVFQWWTWRDRGWHWRRRDARVWEVAARAEWLLRHPSGAPMQAAREAR